MTQSIDTSLVTQFSDMVHMEASQMKSRLSGLIMEKKVTGQTFTYETLGDAEPIEVTTRHAKTVAQDITHSRRGATMRDFRLTFLLDKNDELQTLIDPESGYAKKVAGKLQKKRDELALAAALGSVKTGKNLTSTTTASADGVTTVAAGGVGLTYEKLLEVKENFINNEVVTDVDEDIVLCITGEQHTNLMGETELTSGDYINGKVVDNGRITRALGMKVVLFGANGLNPLIGKTGSNRECVAFISRPQDGAICLGVNKDIDIDVSVRADLNNAKQIQATLFAEALRTEGVLVQQIDCVEA